MVSRDSQLYGKTADQTVPSFPRLYECLNVLTPYTHKTQQIFSLFLALPSHPPGDFSLFCHFSRYLTCVNTAGTHTHTTFIPSAAACHLTSVLNHHIGSLRKPMIYYRLTNTGPRNPPHQPTCFNLNNTCWPTQQTNQHTLNTGITKL